MNTADLAEEFVRGAFEAFNIPLGPYAVIVKNLLDIAVSEERERCATVAENMGRSNGRILSANKRIADEIRSGNDRIGNLQTSA
jgi:hypothetical protein